MVCSSVKSVQGRIQRTSRLAAAVIGVAVIAAPALLAFYILTGFAWGITGQTLFRLTSADMTPLLKVIILATMLVFSAPWLWGLWQLRNLFLGYAAGEVFTEVAAIRFGRFALSLMLTAVAGPLLATTLSLELLQLGAIRPSDAVMVAINQDNLVLMLAGGALWIIASVLRGAAILAEESACFF